MKKFTTLLCLALLLSATNLWAKPITPDVARNTVEEIFTSNRKNFSLKPGASNNLITPAKEYINETEPFYAFNRGEGEGFVLLSGDDELPTIIGYADSGSFSYENMPDALKFYLDEYTAYVTAVQTGKAVYIAPQAYTPEQAIEPLIKTKWNQNIPYCLMCPIIDGDYTPSGCVATAMAQVMKYYNYPAQGRGSHTYQRVDGEVTVDFSQSHYDWANMLDVYNEGEYNEEQGNAVAKLMHDLGVAVDMNYALGGSGAYSANIAPALIEYFGYDENAIEIHRDYMSTAEYMNTIYTELAAGRPLLYGAAALNGGGHQFVCDGMDANGMLHINWGWGGVSDGYFDLNYMDPMTQGIGGSNGNSGYIVGASIIINVQPAPEATNPVVTQHMAHYNNSVTCETSGRDISLSGTIWNFSGRNFEGELAAVTEISGTQRILSQAPFTLDAWYYNPVSLTFTLPDDIADGTYPLYFMTHANSYQEGRWDMVQTPQYLVGRVEITVAGETITVATEEKTIIISLCGSITAEGELNVGETESIIVPLYNEGNTMLQGNLKLEFYDVETNTLQYTSEAQDFIIYDYSNLNVILSVPFTSLTAGKYYVDVIVNNEYRIAPYGDRDIIEVMPPEETPAPTLVQALYSETSILTKGKPDENIIYANINFTRTGIHVFRFMATDANGECKEIFAGNYNLDETGIFWLGAYPDATNLAPGEYTVTIEWLNDNNEYEALEPAKYNYCNVTVVNAPEVPAPTLVQALYSETSILTQGKTDENVIYAAVHIPSTGDHYFRFMATDAYGECKEISVVGYNFSETGDYWVPGYPHAGNLTPGEYTITVEWLNGNNEYVPLEPAEYNSCNVTVVTDETFSTALVLAEPFYFTNCVNNELSIREQQELHLSIKNTTDADIENAQLALVIGNIYSGFSVSIAAGETISGSFNLTLTDFAPGVYDIYICDINNNLTPLTPFEYSYQTYTFVDYTGVEKIETEDVSAYFTNNILNIKNVKENSKIYISNMAGSVLYTGVANSSTVAIPLHVAQGIYLVTIVNDSDTKTIKVMNK